MGKHLSLDYRGLATSGNGERHITLLKRAADEPESFQVPGIVHRTASWHEIELGRDRPTLRPSVATVNTIHSRFPFLLSNRA